MTHALVLGGGGPVGIAWECGLLTSLLEASVPLAAADAVIGTSAGSVVGAALAGGADLFSLAKAANDPLPMPGDRPIDLAAMQVAVTQAAGGASSPEAAMVAIGTLALSSDTVTEEDFIGRTTFGLIGHLPWPASFRCTGINIATGNLETFDASHGLAGWPTAHR